MREVLIDGGVIKNIPTKEMTMADAKALMDAVKANLREAS